MKKIKYYLAFTSKIYRRNLLLFPVLVVLGNSAVCMLNNRYLKGGSMVTSFEMEMLLIVYLLHELMTDTSLVSGLAGKRLNEFTAFLSSSRGMEVFRGGLEIDLFRKAVSLAVSLGLIAAVNLAFYGESRITFFYGVQCFTFIYGVMTLTLMIARLFQNALVNILLFYVVIFGVNAFGTHLATKGHASWLREGQSFYVVLGIVLAAVSCVGTVWISVRKGRNAYYDG